MALAALVGVFLRDRISFLRSGLIPAALVSGALLLLLGPEVADVVPQVNYNAWKKWPGYLISFLFAALILGGSPSADSGQSPLRKHLLPVFQQSLYVWFIALGQLALGFTATLIILAPFNIDPLFSHIIEIGWIGGHGSAAALTGVLEGIGRRDAGDLAIFSATAGLLMGSVSGIILLSYLKRKYIPEPDSETEKGQTPTAAETAPENTSAGALTSALLITTLAVFLAYACRESAIRLGHHLNSAILKDANEMPLFSLALLFAFALKFPGRRLRLLTPHVEREIKRLADIILEVLIISALATLKLTVFVTYFDTFVIMMFLALGFCIFCLLVVAPRMLPRDIWLELGVLNYGMSTGVTALGLLFVKSLRKNVSSRTAEIYGLAAPLSAPLIGGGYISMQLPKLTAKGYGFQILAVLVPVLLVIFLVGYALNRREKKI